EIPRGGGDPWKPEAAAIHSKLREAIAEDEVGKKSQRALDKLNAILGRAYTFKTLPERPIDPWTNAEAIRIHGEWWEARIARQKEIDASIAAKAEYEYLYDKPYPDNKKVRVAGPFTVESLSPHRMVGVDEPLDSSKKVLEKRTGYAAAARDFPSIVLENLHAAGVQQAAKGDKITFTSLQPWPGKLICAEGRYQEGAKEKRAG